jgi:hypothetical protein
VLHCRRAGAGHGGQPCGRLGHARTSAEFGETNDEADPGELERRLRFCAASWDEFLHALRPSGWDADEQAEGELLRRMQIDF